MDLTLHPHFLRGRVDILPSKSFAQRVLICAALADGPTTIHCPQTSADMEATADCLAALGADIQRTSQGFQVTPIRNVPKSAILPCFTSIAKPFLSFFNFFLTTFFSLFIILSNRVLFLF